MRIFQSRCCRFCPWSHMSWAVRSLWDPIPQYKERAQGQRRQFVCALSYASTSICPSSLPSRLKHLTVSFRAWRLARLQRQGSHFPLWQSNSFQSDRSLQHNVTLPSMTITHTWQQHHSEALQKLTFLICHCSLVVQVKLKTVNLIYNDLQKTPHI